MEKEQGIFRLVESSAYARAFLKVDRVRRSSALRLNLLVAITRIVTGSDFVRRAHTKPRCVPFQPLLPKFHPFNIPKFFQSNK